MRDQRAVLPHGARGAGLSQQLGPINADSCPAHGMPGIPGLQGLNNQQEAAMTTGLTSNHV